MNRKDFELVARIIKGMPYGYRSTTAHEFADRLTGYAAGFDRDRFLKACGMPSESDLVAFDTARLSQPEAIAR